MKKNLFFVQILLASVALSCEELEIKTADYFSDGIITRTFTLEDKVWENSVKSSYTEGVGITLSGSEKVAVYYNNYDGTAASQFAKGVEKTPVIATPSAGRYSFSHTAISGAEAYDYYFLMPFRSSHTTGTQSEIRKSKVSLLAVQYPTSTSFDPAFDYLIGKPVEDVAPSTSLSLTVEGYKRIVAPFKLTLKDPSGLLEGEKLHAVTVDFVGGPKVAGKFLLNYDPDADASGIAALDNSSCGTALTAVYPDGLSATSGEYGVWYMSLPADLESGQKIRVTAVGETKSVVCSASLPAASALIANMFNELPFVLSETKDDYVLSNSIHFDFSKTKSVSSTEFLASDGNKYAWSNNGSTAYDASSKEMMICGLKMKPGQTITIPAFSGKKVKSLRIYTHEDSYTSSSSKATIHATLGEETKSALYDAASTGFPQGYVDLVFDSAESGAVTLSTTYSDNSTTHATNFSSVAIFFGEASEPVPGPGPEPEGNDYYARYNSGETLTFGTLEINKTNYPTAALYDAKDLTYTILQGGGLIFVNGNDEAFKLSGDNSTYSVASSAALVLVGRYADKQPKIIARELRANSNDVSLCNINFTTLSANELVTKNSSEKASTALHFVDCTITTGSAKYMILDYNSSSACFTDVEIDNCVINMTPALSTSMLYSSKHVDQTTLQKLSIKNSVIYSTSATEVPYLINGTNLSTTDIVVKNNTFANYYASSGFIRATTAPNSLDAQNNVAYSNGSKNDTTSSFVRFDSEPAGTFVVSYNVLSAVDCSQKWRVFRDKSKEGSAEGNQLITVSPFASNADISTGYLPISTTYSGAGASYAGKKYFTIPE